MVPLEIIRHGEVVQVVSDEEKGRVVAVGWGKYYVRIGSGIGEGFRVSKVAEGMRNVGRATIPVGRRSRDVSVALGFGFQAREVDSSDKAGEDKEK